jgi:nitroimidazol reductase NimA-like FMN-containing flavoprotein (pyridoxamine 5'-phosphate oxidase superfamily)
MPYSKKHIDSFLRDCFFAVLSYRDGAQLKSDLMVFSHHIDGTFYLITRQSSEGFHGISEDPSVSLMIYKEEEDLEAINYFMVSGTGSVIDELDSDDAEQALTLIGDKSPMIRNLLYDEDREKHCIIRVEAEQMSFVNWGDLKQGTPITILEKE